MQKHTTPISDQSSRPTLLASRISGCKVAGETAQSTYLPGFKEYVWRGCKNPAAALIMARVTVAELLEQRGVA